MQISCRRLDECAMSGVGIQTVSSGAVFVTNHIVYCSVLSIFLRLIHLGICAVGAVGIIICSV